MNIMLIVDMATQKIKSTDINEHSHKIFSEIYVNTLKRDDKIKQLGYNLIVKWESDV